MRMMRMDDTCRATFPTDARRTVTTFFAVLTLLTAACGKQAAAPEPPRLAVEATVIAPRDFVVSYRGPASLEGWRVSNLASEITGRIRMLGAEVGDTVRTGVELVRIDASVQAANVSAAQSRVTDAEVAARNASDNFARTQILFRQGVASQQELENAQTMRDRSAEGISLVRASVGAAGGEAGKAVIRAPFNGTVTIRDKEVGEIVTSTSRIYRVEDLSALKAVVNVSERDMSGIREGAAATLRFASGETVAGTVALVAPAADMMSRAVRVEVRIENADRSLRSGIYGEIEIIRDVHPGAILVPRSALLGISGNRATVYVADGGVAHKREVRLGSADDYVYEVLDGVKAGDHVITSGVSMLAEGARVQETNGPRPAASSAGDSDSRMQ